MCECRPRCRSPRGHRCLLVWLAAAGLIFLGWPLLKRLIGELAGSGDERPLTAGSGSRPATGERQTIPATIYRRPDPMIYDQYYLQSLGLAVTWDNPDIHLERPLGTPVPSHDLAPSTDYHVIARIWNLSERAPAPQLPVRVSYLTFGIGTTKTTFAETRVNLPVKGSPDFPVYADVVWTTPPAAGHYCLQVELIWPPADDENPANNLGQHNTDVKALHSPATFEFPVHNDHLTRTRQIRLVADAYAIPPAPACDEPQRAGPRTRHDPASFPVPDGWDVQIAPAELALEPQQEQLVSVTVTAPDGFTGRQPLNIHGYEGEQLLGGVTLYVEGA